MRIEEIHIHRFGGLRNVLIRGLNSGLNVIIGPNEAGKSTALEFIRSMFFGFRKRSGRSVVNTYETGDGAGRHGCLVVCEDGGEKLIIERTERPGKKEGVITISDIHGRPLDPSLVPIPANGMERSAYEALFAFDLDAMRELDREALRGKIIAAALGSFAVNPLNVAAQVDAELKMLVKKSSGNGDSLTALQVRLDEVDREIRSLKDAPSEYARVKEEFERVSLERGEIAAEIPRKESTLAHLTRLLQHEEQWMRLVALERRLADLSDARIFPRNGSALMDQALDRLNSALAGEEDLVRQLEGFRRRFETIVPDEALLERAEEIRSLERNARMLASRPSEIDALRMRIEQARRGLNNDVHDLGKGWSLERVAACDVSLPVEQAVQRYVDAWKAAREGIVDLERGLATAGESSDRVTERARSSRHAIDALEAICRDYLGPHERALVEEWKDQHRVAGHLRDRLADKVRLLERLRPECGELEGERAACNRSLGRAPSLAVTGICAGVLAALGIAATFAVTSTGARLLRRAGGFFGGFAAATAEQYPAAVMIAGSAGLLASLSLIAVHWARTSRRKARLGRLAVLDAKVSALKAEAEALSHEHIVMSTQLNQATARMFECAREALGRGDVALEEVVEAQRRSGLAEESVRKREIARNALTADLAEAERHKHVARDIEGRLDQARTEFRVLQGRWKTFLDRHGLAGQPEPETARELVRRLALLKREIREIEDDEDLLGGLTSAWDEFAANVSSFADRIGREDGEALDAVARWAAGLTHAKEQVIEKQALAERIEDLTARLERHRTRKNEAESAMHALLEQAGVDDEPAFRLRAQRNEEFRRLTDERAGLVRDLVSGLRCTDETSMSGLMDAQDWVENERIAAELASEIGRLREQSEQLAHHAGRLGREVEEMETERSTERLLADKEELVARLREGVERWIVLRLASQLLGRAIDKCEREKQPRVMEMSSEIFRAITGSAFSSVRFPMEGDTIRAVRSDGSVIDEGLLSRGTLEQVYLSMRLAHHEVHHRGDSVFPLVIDDILVNFDADRAARTAGVLTDFVHRTGIQVLFFTCHEHTAELFPAGISKHYLMVQERP